MTKHFFSAVLGLIEPWIRYRPSAARNRLGSIFKPQRERSSMSMPRTIRSVCWPPALSILMLGGTGSALAQTDSPVCAQEAREQAQRLLDFHVGGDDRIFIEPEVVEKAPLRNPANPKQSFQVLEVRGMILKGQYRMRLIYYRFEDSCVLMGQEILEYASL